jgi:hypothetical protein
MIATNRTLTALLTVLLLLVAGLSPTYADTSSSVNVGPLQRFYVNTDGRIFIRLTNRPANAAVCQDQWYVILPNHPQRERLFQTLLTGWTSAVSVGLRVKAGHVDNTFCEVDYVVLNR